LVARLKDPAGRRQIKADIQTGIEGWENWIKDAGRVGVKATSREPHRFPEGIVYVLVNGQIVVENGASDRQTARKGSAKAKKHRSWKVINPPPLRSKDIL